MHRNLSRIGSIVVLGLALAGMGIAQEATDARRPFRHHLRACLSIVDLTDDQKAAIGAILEGARPTFEQNVAAVRAARETLRAALETVPPDACAIGADALAVKSAVATLRAQRDAVLGQIMATLTPDQQSRLQGCLDAPKVSTDEASDAEPAAD